MMHSSIGMGSSKLSGRAASYVIVSSGMSALLQAQADLVVDDISDARVQTMVTAAVYGCVKFIGNFTKSVITAISIPSSVEIDIEEATITLADSLNADGAVFTNSDRTNGNTRIYIHGSGKIIGNEKGNSSGAQYAIDFKYVTKSEIDCFIEDFRTADVLLVGCGLNNTGIKFNNRNYDDEYTPRIHKIAGCESTDELTAATNVATDADHVEGLTSLKITASGNTTITFVDTHDLRFYPLIVFYAKSSASGVIGAGLPQDLSLYNARLSKTYSFGASNSNKYKCYALDDNLTGAACWHQIVVDLTLIDYTTLTSTPDDFLKDVQLKMTVNNSFNLTIDNIYAVRGLPQGIVLNGFDDGHSTQYSAAPYMTKYGYKGTIGLYRTAVTSAALLATWQQLYAAGWDIIGHSWDHDLTLVALMGRFMEDASVASWLAQYFPRSCQYKFYIGSETPITDAVAKRLLIARRYFGATTAVQCCMSLPYGMSQLSLNCFAYESTASCVIVKTQIDRCKKFHTWLLNFTHEIQAGDCEVADFQGVIDYEYDHGMTVWTFSEMYDRYPQTKPQVDFGMKLYTDTYTVAALDADGVVAAEDLSAASPITCTIDGQPTCPRQLTWTLSHSNITAFSMAITGIDAKGVTVTRTITQASGWSGTTGIAFQRITSVVFTRTTGTGAGDTLNIGFNDCIGLRKLTSIITDYDSPDIIAVYKDGALMARTDWRAEWIYDTLDVSDGGGTPAAGEVFRIVYKSPLNMTGG